MTETLEINLSITPRCGNCLFVKRCAWIKTYNVNPCFHWVPHSTWLKHLIESASFRQHGRLTIFTENQESKGGKELH